MLIQEKYSKGNKKTKGDWEVHPIKKIQRRSFGRIAFTQDRTKKREPGKGVRSDEEGEDNKDEDAVESAAQRVSDGPVTIHPAIADVSIKLFTPDANESTVLFADALSQKLWKPQKVLFEIKQSPQALSQWHTNE